MKRKLIRRFPAGNAPPQKSAFTDKGCFGLEDELYYVGKEHIDSKYHPIGLHPIGRYLSFCADCAAGQKNFSENWRLAGSSLYAIRLMSGKGVPHRRIPHRKGVNKMEVAHRKFGNEWGQFDRYCKLVLYHEAIDYLRELQRQSDHEKPLDTLSPEEWDNLSTIDRYPSDSFVFSSHGCSLYIDNELVAAAFADLPQQEQSILILCFVLDMADGEIGCVMGMSRSAVQRHRTSRAAYPFHALPFQ